MIGVSSHTDQLKSQYSHWMQAASRLSNLENMASEYAWNGIDRQVRNMIIESLNNTIRNVQDSGKQIELMFLAGADYDRIRRALLRFRQQYLNAETTVHFFTDALNSRTNASVACMLRACDILCRRSMEGILPLLGSNVPYCFTYLDRGLGASILKSGLRLWDGSISPVAAIKITFHNLYRPTAAIHETGHQVAHILDWNDELAATLYRELDHFNPVIAKVFSSWASEIAADNFAFVHTGYAAVASLHNVVAGAPDSVFAFHQGDPHPISYVRLLLNIECCRRFYGEGAWDGLEECFKRDYPLNRNRSGSNLIVACEKHLKRVVDLCLNTQYRAFAGRSLSQVIDPLTVSPSALDALAQHAGVNQQSHAWINKECLKLLALTGYRLATAERDTTLEYQNFKRWMAMLGGELNMN